MKSVVTVGTLLDPLVTWPCKSLLVAMFTYGSLQFKGSSKSKISWSTSFSPRGRIGMAVVPSNLPLSRVLHLLPQPLGEPDLHARIAQGCHARGPWQVNPSLGLLRDGRIMVLSNNKSNNTCNSNYDDEE